MQRDDLVRYLDDYLRIPAIKDYGPQGLQVEGKSDVQRIIGSVDAQLPCVRAALDNNADLLLVHHGIFWGPAQRLSGAFGELVRTYMRHDLNLYAAHLALDAHPVVGNNAQLALLLDLDVIDWWDEVNGTPIAVLAQTQQALSFEQLVTRFRARVGPVKLVQAEGPDVVRTVGILSGFGAREVEKAATLGCDAYITGETSHAEYYAALNAGINVLYGGHYTTETVGVKALGAHLQEAFGIEFLFIDLPTGL